jgi:hypothetical protein
MDFSDSVLRMLVASDPRHAIDLSLEFLQTAHAARSIAVFTAEDGQPRLRGSRALVDEGLRWSTAHVASAKKRLEAGRIVRRDNYSLVPLIRDQRLEGILYLDSNRVDLPAITDATNALLNALKVEASGVGVRLDELETYLVETPAEEIERRQVVLALERSEWTIARAARLLQLSRRGLYKKMERLGIERKKLRKSERYWREKEARGEA